MILKSRNISIVTVFIKAVDWLAVFPQLNFLSSMGPWKFSSSAHHQVPLFAKEDHQTKMTWDHQCNGPPTNQRVNLICSDSQQCLKHAHRVQLSVWWILLQVMFWFTNKSLCWFYPNNVCLIFDWLEPLKLPFVIMCSPVRSLIGISFWTQSSSVLHKRKLSGSFMSFLAALTLISSGWDVISRIRKKAQ